jgi:FkbM family methyltransferase
MMVFNSNFSFLQYVSSHSFEHARGTDWFTDNEQQTQIYFHKAHGPNSSGINLFEIGEIHFPFFQMGEIDSRKLFGLDEIILFSFYFLNRGKYKKTLDLGANIGLHTLVMRKLGFDVISYEPDEVHLKQLQEVMQSNGFDYSGIKPKAISNKNGSMEYIRILGNTTGSHLLGSKENVYGPTEVVSVKVDDILEVLDKGKFDFVKMDVEGHEVVLLNRITAQSIATTDIMLEIGSDKNAKEIFTILSDKKIPAYAQKINWARVERVQDLPSHHTHGSLFLSMQGPPKWN